MAKKKKKAKKSFNFHQFLTITLAVLVILLTIGLIRQHNPRVIDEPIEKAKQLFSKPSSGSVTMPSSSDQETIKTVKKISTLKTSKKAPAEKNKISASDLKQIKGLDIPTEPADRNSQLITHAGYTVSYNSHWKIANWVGYELTRQETRGSQKRTNKFVADPQIKGASATDADYKLTGYDRGHMAPAADMSWSNTAMKESFYFSNICPQDPGLNRGVWKEIEDNTRKWAQRDSAIYVICGPLMNDTNRTIGKNRVLVPAQFYKVILSPFGKKPKAIGFLLKNKGTLKTPESFAVSVDSIEKLTGINFFRQLPDPIEEKIEQSFNLSEWF